jgi:heat shock protein HtpX
MYQEIASNKRKSWLIITAFVIVVGLVALAASYYFFHRPIFTILVVAMALVYALISYFNAAKMAVALNGAKEVTAKEQPRLYRTVENLSISQGMPMPKVYVMDDPAPNAFATGRDPEHAVVAATTGLVEMMDDSELEGVMAHEMGHVKNFDIRVSMLAFALVSVIAIISDIMIRSLWFGGGRDDREGGNGPLAVIAIVFVILAPISAKLLQLAISRQREFLADATGALATRYPQGLASALEKIKLSGSTLKRQNTATAHLFFANPLKVSRMKALFSTHPPLEERIARLNGMGK